MHDDIVIFLGPSLSHAEATSVLHCHYLPPAKQGDIYKAFLQFRPKIIGLIDGNFENVPSPWHKEILFVMAQGTYVYGASSMGALRAAELHDYGMIGVGEIFEAFHNNKLEDDDEVAIIHGPEKIGYPNLSEAMVNIRKTLEIAYYEKIIGREFHHAAIEGAKKLFYAERNYGRLLKDLSHNPDLKEDSISFGIWLEYHRRDQKKDDALKLLKILGQNPPTSPMQVDFILEKTIFFEEMCNQIKAEIL